MLLVLFQVVLAVLTVLVGHARDHIKKIIKLGFHSICDRVAKDPFYCFNMAQQALTPKAMAFPSQLAEAMIPTIDRSKEEIMIEAWDRSGNKWPAW